MDTNGDDVVAPEAKRARVEKSVDGYALFAYAIATTGIDVGDRSPLQYGVVRIDSGEAFQVCVNTSVPLKDITTKLTGLTSDRLAKEGVSPSAALNRFVEWIETKRGDKPAMLIAHNNFDFFAPVLKDAATESKVVLPDNWVFGDTISMARTVHPPKQSWALKSLRHSYGLGPKDVNDAMDNAKTVHCVFIGMKLRFVKKHHHHNLLKVLTNPYRKPQTTSVSERCDYE